MAFINVFYRKPLFSFAAVIILPYFQTCLAAKRALGVWCEEVDSNLLYNKIKARNCTKLKPCTILQDCFQKIGRRFFPP